MKSLFSKLGGQEAINLAVDKFYDKVLQDSRVNTFFKNTDMKKQRQGQKDFLTTAFGGPNVYKGKDLREAHKHLKLSDKDYDVIVEILLGTLRELGIDERVISEVNEVVQSIRNPILNKKSIYERIGGQESVDLAIDRFYEKVLQDNRVKHFFNKTDMKKQAQMQKDFVTTALGGPKVYKGKDMKAAHAHLKITDYEFDAIVELLITTLQELGVGSDIIAEIRVILESVRADTLNKKSIYERIGGAESIDVAVDKFYEKVLKDDRVKKFFAKTNMPDQMVKQKQFLTQAFGGPKIYNGKDMRAAHKGMGLRDLEFNAIVELLAKTLKELGVSDSIINEIAQLVEPLRKEMVEKF